MNKRQTNKMKALPFVSIVIVNYNGKKYLKNCFGSLFALNYPRNKLEIIMVDNCSTDSSLDYVKSRFSKVRIIKNDINNYTKANNLGLKKARGKYIALLNNDTKVDKNWLRELVKIIDSDKTIAASGSKILFMDGKIESAGHKRLPNFYWVDKGTTEEDSSQYEELTESGSLCGCAVLYRKKAVQDIGGFDEDFNMYLEDVDMSIRLRRKKWKLSYVPTSLVYHLHHGTSSDELALFYSERNRLLLVAKYYPKRLAQALWGKGYFTVKKDITQLAGLYRILTDLILKLIKHHKIDTVRDILSNLFAELKRISNVENNLLVDKIGELINSVNSQQEVIRSQSDSLGSLNLELQNKMRELQTKLAAIQEKEQLIQKLDQELSKKDELITSQNSSIVDLNSQLGIKSSELENRNHEFQELERQLQTKLGAIQEKEELIRSLDNELNKKDQLIASQNSSISDLNSQLNLKSSELETKNQELHKLNCELEDRLNAIQEKEQLIQKLDQELSKKDQLITTQNSSILDLSSQIASKDSELQTKLGAIQEKEELIRSLDNELNKKDQLIASQNSSISDLNSQLNLKSSELETKNQELQRLNQELEARLADIQEKEELIRNLDDELNKKDQLINAKESSIAELNSELNAKNSESEAKSQQIDNLSRQAEDKLMAIKEKETLVSNLNLEVDKKNQELIGIYNSNAFKYLVRPLWSFLWPIKQFIRSLIKPKLSHGESEGLQDKGNIVTYNNQMEANNNIAICTIISKNYLAYARVLTESFLEYNQGEVFVLLTDKVDGYFDPAKEKFTLIEIAAIKDRIPDFEKFSFQYNPTELNTAVKPFFLEFLFEKYSLSKLIFFDPDILITHKLNELSNLLDRYSIILIPHITQPFPDNHKPAELEILRSGVYNLGFIALSDKNSTRNLLTWWKERLRRYCTVDIEHGLFVDQKWIDLIPGFFEDAYILRDPAYNIAYWNFHYRKVYMDKESGILIDGQPVHFLHFSGLNPQDADSISKHQDRFKLNDLTEMKQIFQLYKNKLIANGYNLSKKWPCVFNYFDNGAKIPDILRRVYWEVTGDTSKDKFSNPFITHHNNSYFNWLNEGIDNKLPKISRFMYEIYKKRMDVQLAYPDIFNLEREKFFQWFLSSPKKECDLDTTFLERIFPFNVKKKQQVLLGINIKAYHKIRVFLKKFLKKTFNNNLWVINNLRMAEIRYNRKIAYIHSLFIKKTDYPKIGSNKHGVNLFGYLTAELGIGEGARANANCLKSAGINFSLINIDNHSASRKYDSSFSEFSQVNPYDINLIHVNADMFSRLYAERGNSSFKDKYNIGFWTWELSDFPDEWLNSFNYCDEIWVPSNFALASVAKKSPVPVLKMPHAVTTDSLKDVNRSYFELKDDEFVFLFIFDFFSYFERKNPLAIIQAFKKAFLPSENVKLVIKCSNSSFNPLAFNTMKEAAKGLNIKIIDNYLYRDEINALISLCDCYISLHRSEGFGLTMAEAMFLGKPVIATGYSGNTDFMDFNNSYLVRYKLVEIDKDAGPYRKGRIWAHPDIGHAAELMRYVYNNQEAARETGKKATEDIKLNLNYNTVGSEIRNRIERIYKGLI